MNDSNLNKNIENEVTKKIREESKKSISQNETVDVDVEVLSIEGEASKSENKEKTNKSSDVKNNNSQEFLDEFPKIFSDGKPKKESKKAGPIDDGEQKNSQNQNKEMMKQELKQGANVAKEAGKDAAAKVGGAAISAVTEGIIPPKVGEFITKKSLDKLEKKGGEQLKHVKRIVKNEAQNVKNDIKEKVENSEVVKKVKKEGEKGTKKVKKVINAVRIIKFFKKYGVIIATVLGIVLLVSIFIGLISVIQTYVPGLFGNVNEEYDTQPYSKRDLKILDKIGEVVKSYPTVNSDQASLVLAATSYPYHTLLQSDNVKSLTKIQTDSDEEDELDEFELLFEEDENLTLSEKYKKYKLIYSSLLQAGKEFIKSEFEEWYYEKFGKKIEEPDEDEEDELETENDMYLTMYNKDKYLKKFDELMKVYSEQGESGFYSYLEQTYYSNDDGYKRMFRRAGDDAKEELIKEIRKDIEDNKSFYKNYIIDSNDNSEICSSNSQSLGYSYELEAIDGEVAIVLKDTTSTKFSDIKAAKSLYGTDDLHLNLKRYTLGVIYNEVGEYVKYEQLAKAEMIAVKSFVLGRTAPGSSETMGMGFKSEKINGKTVFYLRGNTYDQGFCDVYEGCLSGSKYDKDLVVNDPNGETHGNKKPAMSAEDIANLEKWYDETAGEFVYDNNNKVFNGAQYNDFNSRCKKGSCLSQTNAIKQAKAGSDYNTILFKESYSESRFTLYNSETKSVLSVSINCNNSNTTCGINDNDFIYYSQKVGEYSEVTFCNSSKGVLMKKAGCGVTSMAMVIANLSDSTVTPLQTNKEATEYGYCSGDTGTSPDYFKKAAEKYKLTIKLKTKTNSTNIEESANEIVNTIRNGGLVIINVNPSWLNHSSGHYLVAKGVDEDGNLVIADPYADSLTTPVRNNISAEEIIKNYVDNGHGWYMFTSDKSKSIVEKYCANESEVILGGNSKSGYLGNPLNPADTKKDFMQLSTAKCFPRYCSGGAHSGIDLNKGNSGASMGAKVYAMDSGTVSDVGSYAGNCYPCSSAGISVNIDHGNGYETGYWHLSKRVVQKGQKVKKGQLIGYVGNTGNSKGAHLHIVLKNKSLYSKYGWSGARGHSDRGFMNPAKYINKNVSYAGKTK